MAKQNPPPGFSAHMEGGFVKGLLVSPRQIDNLSVISFVALWQGSGLLELARTFLQNRFQR